jgi:hypothetical protein
MAKLTAFDQQIRVLESFHSSTDLSKKTKIALFYGTKGVALTNIKIMVVKFPYFN